MTRTPHRRDLSRLERLLPELASRVKWARHHHERTADPQEDELRAFMVLATLARMTRVAERMERRAKSQRRRK